MPSPERPASNGPSRRTVLGWMGGAAVGAALPAGILATPGVASAEPAAAAAAANAAAPRPYFPADITQIPRNGSLPDLFAFFGRSATGADRVVHASQWPARRAELVDLMQYYLYGYKQPTPVQGSVFRQIQIPETRNPRSR